jgi:phospholipase/lecithinase/hemolysin
MTAALNDSITSGALPIDMNALYLVWGGPNDFFSITDPSQAPGTILTAVTNLLTITATLQSLGATQIIVAGMPDLSLTPYVRSLDVIAPGTALLMQGVTMGFNTTLQSSLPAGVRFFDTNSVFLNVYTDPSAFGITNVTTPCNVSGVVCTSPDQYLFWDGVHPTTQVHSVMGSALAEAVPEPSTYLTISVGFIAIIFASRRKLTRQR